MSDGSPQPAWDRQDAWLLTAALVLGAVVRFWYLAAMQLGPYDPWRHLQLVRNLRAGAGFTLFAGEPYVWYQPPWYWLCSWLPAAVGPQWVAAVCSLASVALVYVWLRRLDGGGRLAAAAAALFMAGYAPLIKYTCHYGPEALALCLLLAAVVTFQTRSSVVSDAIAGGLLGLALVLRLNYVFNAFLFVEALPKPRRALPLCFGGAIPLGLAWWRNHAILTGRPWVFTWDGLATPSAEFGWLSTLVIQRHPDVATGLRRLHAELLPTAEWLTSAWLFVFVAATTLAVLLGRRWGSGLTYLVGLAYLTLLDPTGSARFMRTWVGLFPVMFLALAFVVQRLASRPRWGRPAAGALAAGVLIVGLPFLSAPRGAEALTGSRVGVPLEMVTPPVGLLTEERYLVNSGFYHPQGLVYRHPDLRVLGLPLEADDFPAFVREYPEFRTVLWHEHGVQDDLLRDLLAVGRLRPIAERRNAHGLLYRVFEVAPGG